MKDNHKYGIFVYSTKGENEGVDRRYRSNKKSAIELATKIIISNLMLSHDNVEYKFSYEDYFIEVWEKDKDGLWGNTGIPIWCTRNSGYFDAVIKHNEEVKRQKYFGAKHKKVRA